MSKYTANTVILSLLAAMFFVSCGTETTRQIEIGGSYYYWEGSAKSKLGDALRNADSFKKLDDTSVYNLSNVLGKGAHYVWIRAEFDIPPRLEGQTLGLVVPRLRFAEELYCNRARVFKYGSPQGRGALSEVQLFSFPTSVLNRDGENTIFIKMFTQGLGGISTHAVIMPFYEAYSMFERLNFYHARVYIFLVGIQLFAFILYLVFYIKLRKFREYFDFAIINIFTLVLLIPFFVTELPSYWVDRIPFLLFAKCTLWLPLYVIGYFLSSFVMHYQKILFSRSVDIMRASVLAGQIVVMMAMPTYETLMLVAPLLLSLSVLQLAGVFAFLVRNLFRPYSRMRALECGIIFLPVICAAVFDIVIRAHDKSQTYPVFSLFGWLFSILGLLVVLIMRFSRIYKDYEQLTDHLQDEVNVRTQDLYSLNRELSRLNEHLEDEKFKADMDLQMASLVQQRFLPQPNKQFRGWDIAVYYSPSSIVSGDLYDYYNDNEKLNGLALFDVSGHGISSSLVAMLSKNIISRVFQKGFIIDEPIDRVLNRINNVILNEKGDIDNYLTGILCRFEADADSDTFRVELGNAGHPYPLKFSARDNEIFELRGNSGKKYYGAIGMRDIDISFAKSDFVMAEGDVLICYTDGLTEALNTKQEQFGAERVKQLVKENSALSANELLKCIMKSHTAFTKGKQLEDDITLVIAKRTNMAAFVSQETDDDQEKEDFIELFPIEDEVANVNGGGVDIVELLPVED